VTNHGSANGNTVTRILKADLSTTTITVGTAPYGVAVDETYCWVVNYGSNNVIRILKADLSTTTIAVGATGPRGVAVDGTYCWVANHGSPSGNNVSRILKSDSTKVTITVGTGPFSLGDMTGYAYDNYSRVP
jgi:DNA-binding beta-propeller fold protein YncE